jgi:hypothetical protein
MRLSSAIRCNSIACALDPSELTNPWELTWSVANSRAHVLEYLELAHMHKGEVIGEEKETL